MRNPNFPRLRSPGLILHLICAPWDAVVEGDFVSLVLPTYNERKALGLLAPRIARALSGVPHEILVVDDASPDGTGALVDELAQTEPFRLVARRERSGLASAVLAGFAQARGNVLAVMDADGSHPPESLPSLIGPVLERRAEYVLASRATPGGDYGDLPRERKIISWAASALVRPLTHVSDPMSGFFAFDRRILPRAQLAPTGFKIGLELIVRCRPSPVGEVPYHFSPRLAGESKLTPKEIVRFVVHLSRLYGA